MWKPGQIVTVGGKVCRVTKMPQKVDYLSNSCYYCVFRGLRYKQNPCWAHMNMASRIMPIDCYLKEIKP